MEVINMDKKGGLTRKEQIEHDKKEIERLQNRIKQNEAKEKEKERKERTKRLVELGAIVEKRLSEKAIDVLKSMTTTRLSEIDKWLVNQYNNINQFRKELNEEINKKKQEKNDNKNIDKEPLKEQPTKQENPQPQQQTTTTVKVGV